MQVLFCLLSSVVMPGMGGVVPQPAFPLLDVADDGAVIGATPAAGCGAGAGQSQLFAAITLENDITRVPLVGPAERNLATLVVGLDTLYYPYHSLNPFPDRPRIPLSCVDLLSISVFAAGLRDEW
jgi:hypothetical protein